MPDLPLSPQTLPQGICPDTYQSLLNLFAQNLFVTVPASFGVQWIFGPTKPSPADNDKAWLRTDSIGRPIRPYLFAQGCWLSLHAIEPGLTQWWFRPLPDFTTFDGGDSTTVDATETTGPMWRAAKYPDNNTGTIIAAKFPIVAGTLPAPPDGTGTVLSVGDTGGEELHVLTQKELPKAWNGITSVLRAWRTNLETLAGQWLAPPAAAGASHHTTPDTEEGSFDFVNTGGDQGHNNLGPYIVGYLLQRTVRKYYCVS